MVDENRIMLLSELTFESWQSEPEESKQYAEKALYLADSLNDELGKSYATLAFGLGKWAQEDFNGAMENFLEAEKMVSMAGDSNDIMRFKYEISIAYLSEHIIDLSNRNFEKLMPYYKKSGNEEMLARTYQAYGLGRLYDKKYQDAIRFLDLAADLFEGLKDKYGLTNCALYKGISYLKQGDLLESNALIKKALKGYRNFEDHRGMVMAEKEIGKAFFTVNQPDSARHHLGKALEMARAQELDEEQYEIYYALYEIEFSLKNYKEALKYYKEHISTFDKRVNRQISYQVHEMKMKYDKEKNEQEIKLLNQEKKIQNSYIISLSLLIIVISISGVGIGLTLRNNRRKDKELNMSKEALMQAEISNARLKEKELKIELEKKDMELASYTMNFIKKGELLTELQEKLSDLESNENEKMSSGLRELRSIIKHHVNTDNDWDDFKRRFESVHPSFINAIQKKQNDLSSSEIRLASLLKLNLNSKQIADVMGISPDSVKTARHRLRNRFALERGQNLTQYLNQLEAEELVRDT